MNSTRLARPVRSSCRASCWSFSSATLRAVMSDCDPAIRDGRPSVPRTARPRVRTQSQCPSAAFIRCSSRKCSLSPSRWASSLRLKGRLVVGMNPFEPLPRTRADLVLRVAEHLLPAGREVDRVGAEIPVEDAVVGALDRQGIAFLAVAESVVGGLAGDGVADRAHQQSGVDLAFDEVVLGALTDRAGREFVVIETREDDHRDPRCRLVDAEEGVEPEAVGQREIEQHNVEPVCSADDRRPCRADSRG